MKDPLQQALTRRRFLATTSSAVTAAAASATMTDVRALRAPRRQKLPVQVGVSPHPASHFLPDPTPADDFRALATVAIEAATAAGASFADIRVSERQFLDLGMWNLSPIMPLTTIASTFDFGLRVLVDGAWSFVHGTNATKDAVTTAAREAVVTAKGYASHVRHRWILAPVAPAHGEWMTPHQIDPFTVPLEDQAALMGAYRAAALRVRYGADSYYVAFKWTRETRVYASSDGSLTTQTLYRSNPFFGAQGNLGLGDRGDGVVWFTLPGVVPAAGGYETVLGSSIQDDLKRLAEETVQLASLPRHTLDVGRYPVVFDGMTFGAALGSTIGPALELDRVLGYEADASGTSYLAPPDQVLGTQITSPLLSVKAHRTLPTFSAVKWDDEGVEPEPYDVITEGTLVDYHTSRATAPALTNWYAKRGMPVRPHGCLTAFNGDAVPLIRAPHLTVTPGTQRALLEDLVRDVPYGVLVRGIRHFAVDHQLTGASLMGAGSGLFEIEKGTVVHRLDGNGLQFRTKTFWKGLLALGDQRTMLDNSFELEKGQPWRSMQHLTTAPAGLFKDIDVVSTKRRV